MGWGRGDGGGEELGDFTVVGFECKRVGSLDGGRRHNTRLEQERNNLGVALLGSHTNGVVIVGSWVDAIVCKQEPNNLGVAPFGSPTDGGVIVGSWVDAIVCEQEPNNLGVALLGSVMDDDILIKPRIHPPILQQSSNNFCRTSKRRKPKSQQAWLHSTLQQRLHHVHLPRFTRHRKRCVTNVLDIQEGQR